MEADARAVGLGSGFSLLAYEVLRDWNHVDRASSLELEAALFGSTMPIDVLGPAFSFRHDISSENIDEARKEFLAIVDQSGIDDDPGNLRSRSSSE